MFGRELRALQQAYVGLAEEGMHFGAEIA